MVVTDLFEKEDIYDTEHGVKGDNGDGDQVLHDEFILRSLFVIVA